MEIYFSSQIYKHKQEIHAPSYVRKSQNEQWFISYMTSSSPNDTFPSLSLRGWVDASVSTSSIFPLGRQIIPAMHWGACWHTSHKYRCGPHQDLNAARASWCIPAIWLYIVAEVPAARHISFLRVADTFFGRSFSVADICAAMASNAYRIKMTWPGDISFWKDTYLQQLCIPKRRLIRSARHALRSHDRRKAVHDTLNSAHLSNLTHML